MKKIEFIQSNNFTTRLNDVEKVRSKAVTWDDNACGKKSRIQLYHISKFCAIWASSFLLK